ncbi:MAG TPA: hypothetical protein VLW75_01155 [Rhizomicrobium sp.]|nr:hypothetical protein [Rhizomicrobium sp.]
MPENLTGVWQGLYTYPSRDMRVMFGATLIESASWLSGSTHEECPIGPEKGQTLYATLLGTRNGSLITFTKTYDGSSPRYRSVQYEGTLSSEATEIEGRWMTSATWSGRFLMIRSNGKTQEIERKVFERI